MSRKGFTRYWQNYHRAMEWNKSNELEYWKARSSALEVENASLREELHLLSQQLNSSPNLSRNLSTSTQFISAEEQKYNEIASFHDDQENSDVDFEEEISDDLLAFYEQSIRHQMELKKRNKDHTDQEERQLKSDEKNATLPFFHMNDLQRTSNMELLYGDSAPKIQGMETALHLSFRRHCEKHNARLWPNIPLRL